MATLHDKPFHITYKSWGRLLVRHVRNTEPNGWPRLMVLKGEDKDCSFVVSPEAMQAAIEAEGQGNGH